jgi:hypothetical protein
MKIIVITDEWTHVDNWRHEHGIGWADIEMVRHPSDMHKLRGGRGTPYVKVGRWYELPHLREIEGLAGHLGLVPWEPEEKP